MKSWIVLMVAVVVTPQDGALEITGDTTLDPTKSYGRIVIKASNVTIDGKGAWLIGAVKGDPKTFKGVAIEAKGVSKVTLKNVNAKGWETGLSVADGSGWTIENCNFSDNFHDPKFGWGENGRRGGIVLERVTKSTLRKCRANNVWDAFVMVRCDENTVEECDFSHTSNTCLKMWTSSRNTIRRNNLSWGLRIDPGEVHARDSTSVLIESGSNDNTLLDNDCTHGGDGIFVRILNGWVCTGNRFEGNDCSYANNNAFEAWSPGNTYVRNKANHSSYGFWLGASDKTVLIDNEAAHNGDPKGVHNSPHLPQGSHAGIVFMFGPSSHTIVRGNHLHDNNGAGVAVIGDQPSKGGAWKAYHWIIEQNRIENNRWGIYAQYADWIDLGANEFKGNTEDVKEDGGVTNLTQRKAESNVPPKCVVEGPSFAKVGEKIALDATKSTGAKQFRWDLGDGTTSTLSRVEHAFKAPGFYRVGVTVTNGLSDLGWRDFYVVEDVTEIGTEGQAAEWSWIDGGSTCAFKDDKVVRNSGASSLFALVEPYSGGRVSLSYPKGRGAGVSLKGKTHIVFWVKAVNENLPAWQGENPIVTLHESEAKRSTITPQGDFMSTLPYSEAREGWAYFVVPLAGDKKWKREGDVETVNWLTIGFDSWGAPTLRIWLDGLAVK